MGLVSGTPCRARGHLLPADAATRRSRPRSRRRGRRARAPRAARAGAGAAARVPGRAAPAVLGAACYGTLCAASEQPRDDLRDRDVAFMRVLARLLADVIEHPPAGAPAWLDGELAAGLRHDGRVAHLAFWVVATPRAVKAARRAIDCLADWIPTVRLGDLQMVVSELVTNSIRHGGLEPSSAVGIDVVVEPGVVRGTRHRPRHRVRHRRRAGAGRGAGRRLGTAHHAAGLAQLGGRAAGRGRRRRLLRARARRAVTVELVDVAEGLWLWRQPHPDWEEGNDWDPLVTSVAVASRGVRAPARPARAAAARARGVGADRRAGARGRGDPQARPRARRRPVRALVRLPRATGRRCSGPTTSRRSSSRRSIRGASSRAGCWRCTTGAACRRRRCTCPSSARSCSPTR